MKVFSVALTVGEMFDTEVFGRIAHSVFECSYRLFGLKYPEQKCCKTHISYEILGQVSMVSKQLFSYR